MLGAHRKNTPITEDPLPLPIDFYVDHRRRCEFFSDARTSGVRGVAYAVLLRAIEDGVCEKWLRLLSWFYEVELPEEYLSRHPERQLRLNMLTHRVGSANLHRITLSWFDMVPITGRSLLEKHCA